MEISPRRRRIVRNDLIDRFAGENSHSSPNCFGVSFAAAFVRNFQSRGNFFQSETFQAVKVFSESGKPHDFGFIFSFIARLTAAESSENKPQLVMEMVGAVIDNNFDSDERASRATALLNGKSNLEGGSVLRAPLSSAQVSPGLGEFEAD